MRDVTRDSAGMDVYFRPEFLRVSEVVGGGQATSLMLGYGSMRAFCPLLVRRNERVADAFTPYGYGGLLWRSRAFVSAAASRYLFECLRRWCRNQGLVCCLLRLHPLLAEQFSLEGVADAETLVRRTGVTLGLDLSKWNIKRDIPVGMRKGRISDLSVAKRTLSVELLRGKEQIAASLGAFREMYEANMVRLNATPFYHFPEAYYAALLSEMDEYTMLAVAREGEEMVGASLFLKDENFAHYHLSATTDKGLSRKAPTLLLIEAARWAREQGCSWLHLGGGIHPHDSLYDFKASFGGSEFPYFAVTVVADREKYEELVKQPNPIWPYGEAADIATLAPQIGGE